MFFRSTNNIQRCAKTAWIHWCFWMKIAQSAFLSVSSFWGELIFTKICVWIISIHIQDMGTFPPTDGCCHTFSTWIICFWFYLTYIIFMARRNNSYTLSTLAKLYLLSIYWIYTKLVLIRFIIARFFLNGVCRIYSSFRKTHKIIRMY